MRLFLMTTLTMIAFAANSVLNRLALAPGDMDGVLFGAVRLVSGAVVLAGLVLWQGRGFALGGAPRLWGVAALLAYIFGFSLAYGSLDPGFGALILFAVVQITMFAGALASREVVPPLRWLGAALALGGLGFLLAPGGAGQLALLPVLAMVAAGLGWGLYSLLGRAERDPLQATMMNFVLSVPFAAVIWVLMGEGRASGAGLVCAVLSGAVTSGLGYALWYRLLPALGASRAAVSQLSVPILALGGGMLFLNEALTLRFMIAACLVMAGVLLSLWRPRRAESQPKAL